MDMSKSSDYRDFIWAIELNYLSLALIGLWPKADGISKRSLCSNIQAAFSFIVIIFLFIIPIVHALTRVWGDMELMIDNLRVTLPALTVVLKFTIMRWKQSVLLSVINMIREDWTTSKLNTEREVMMKRGRIIRMIIICAYIVVMFTITVISILPCFGLSFRHLTNLTDRNKPLLLQSYYVYDTDKSPQFELTYLSQVVALLFSAIIYISVDTFYLFIIFHICGQLENLKCRLISLVTCKKFKILSYYVTTHLRLIRCATNVEDIFNLMMLGSIIYFSILLCLALYVLLIMISNEKINAANFSRLYFMMFLIIYLFFQMFFYCYAGELLTEQNEAVYRAVCDLQWYKWESKEARNLIILIIRVQEPIHITAGKIIPLTMITFCSLIKTSASYIPFLLAIQD